MLGYFRGGCIVLGVLCGIAAAQMPLDTFVNFETPQIHPLALSPDGMTLAACNTADGRLELFSLAGGSPQWVASVPVGIDPVAVRFRTADEAWVVNHISDSVNIVSISQRSVVRTLRTLDEPTDVVFATANVGPVEHQIAFIACSQVNKVLAINASDPAAPFPLTWQVPFNGNMAVLTIDGEDPRALAVSPDGRFVYAAIFESGNRSTILAGGADDGGTINFPPNVVDDSNTPHGTMNPPFNTENGFFPPKNPANGTPPKVGLIVKQDAGGAWRDDTGADWTSFVSGVNAAQSGRPIGWTLLDHDLAVIDTFSGQISYVDGLMNLNMNLAVNPVSGNIAVIGTDATNEIRFEPVISGKFLRVNVAMVRPSGQLDTLADMNAAHILNYTQRRIPQSERNKSIGDPRGIAWTSDGKKAWVTGRGSNNVIVVDEQGRRAGIAPTIPVGEGPTGIVLDETRGKAYVLNHFGASISVINMDTEIETARVGFFDPTPQSIRVGRKHLYDTHKTSGLGQIACASCHIDARMDRLAWDLGDPAGDIKNLDNLNLFGNIPGSNLLGTFQPFHPMKGPMVTQTLQGIIGHEPLHWRGDRLGLEEFNPAFVGLQGDDVMLTPAEMQEFEDFLATIHFPPNPFRNKDNSLPTNLPLEGHYVPPRFGAPPGTPLPNGNAVRGLALYRDQNRKLDGGILACVTCHTLPSGNGPDARWNGTQMAPIPVGPMGEHHLMLVQIDGSTNVSIKVAQLRNLYDKVGMNMNTTISRAGFGFLHDGSVDSLERFVSEGAFNTANPQEAADLTALMLAFSGSDFNVVPAGGFLEVPGAPSDDAHAAVGMQTTLVGGMGIGEVQQLVALVDASNRIDLVAKAKIGNDPRGWWYTNRQWRSDSRVDGRTWTLASFFEIAAQGSPVTFTVVASNTGRRLGIDRDLDDCFDFDEILANTSPTNPNERCAEGEGEGEGEGEPEGEDTTPPVIALLGPTNMTHPCGNVFADPGASAFDDRDGNLTSQIVRTGTVQFGVLGVYTLTYAVSDAAGNTAQAQRTVQVVDITGPIITLQGPADFALPCGAPFNDPGATANDACSGPRPVVVQGGPVNTQLPGNYVLTYTAADALGNQAAPVQRVVRVVDAQGPTITLIGPSVITVNCGGPFDDPGATAQDACEGNVSSRVTVSGALNLNAPGVYTLSYTATDSSGNLSPAVTRRVTVADTQPPAITLLGANPLTVDCGTAYVDPGATANDACAGAVNVNVDASGVDTSVPGSYRVRFSAADNAGNAAIAERMVHVAGTACSDLDGDGLPDAWETQYFASLAFGANDDNDSDGLNNQQEFNRGTDPTKRDSDGDGVSDGDEVRGGSDPLDPNSKPPKGALSCSGAGGGHDDGIAGDLGTVVLLVAGLLLLRLRFRAQAV